MSIRGFSTFENDGISSFHHRASASCSIWKSSQSKLLQSMTSRDRAMPRPQRRRNAIPNMATFRSKC